ncbi:DUF5658 family protein [Peribacillus sp. SCS-37]|uniref:DUF5658 family protein n=1 Tax=Paraperibacillus esterisolvens TaxID=3115296 RepID=UPI0039065FD4
MLLVLAVLNLIDGICTYLGITFFHLKEGNPLMASLLQVHPILFLTLKLLLSAGLAWLHTRELNILQHSGFRILMYTAILLYLSVTFMHGFWIAVV